jgi:tRNA U34 5-carboxymethylaminomethyl modifying GTPase MnmE/TrmE
MNMDKDDLAALCAGLTTDEVDRIHRLLREWSVGPDSSFPVQLSLLTRAQWRIAANLPRLMNDVRKLIEAHLAEYRRQTKAMMDDFSTTAQRQTEELKTALESYAKITEHAAGQIQTQLADVESVARRVKSLMEGAVSEWKGIKASTTAQCERLEQVAKDLENRFAWRVILETAGWFSLAIVLGVLFGHYCWPHH